MDIGKSSLKFYSHQQTFILCDVSPRQNTFFLVATASPDTRPPTDSIRLNHPVNKPVALRKKTKRVFNLLLLLNF